MAKTPPLGVRLSKDEREALEMAAKADDRAVSAMARKLIIARLESGGWLKPKGSLNAR